jgi:cis-3-alkyl-4-acyloxetan-2-one decarboxylase
METGPVDGPVVLCVHGNPTWGFLYRKVAAELRGSGYRVVMPDLIGLGFSSKPTSMPEHTLDTHIEWFGHLIDALRLKSVVLVVQDWGGAIGVGALLERAEELAGIVVLNTVLGPPKEGFRATLFHRLAQAPVISDLAFRGLGFPQVNLSIAQGDKRSIRGDVSRAYRWPLRGRARNAAPLALARMVPDSLSHPSVPALRRIQEFTEAYKGPAAIVWGDRDPVLGRLKNRLSRWLPQAKVTSTQAGHFLQEEVPGAIAAAIRTVRG